MVILFCACSEIMFIIAHTKASWRAEDNRGSSTRRPITDATHEPLSVYLISPPPRCCDIQEGPNGEVCLPTTPTASQVKTLKGQAPSRVPHPSTSSLSEKYLKISHQKLYSAFMAVIQDEVPIRAVPNKYVSEYRQIKDLIAQFESTQQDVIFNKQKKLVENRDQLISSVFLATSNTLSRSSNLYVVPGLS